ncbi:hypothetical protein F2P56_007371 [Juglans regia]|uniref:Transcription factor MYB8-like n=2 Tax=Juglans regia TaxID=51240 RepID=A0A2I4FIC1_JUGRE|nr:transcription factor MYB8-like [Juglans regia]KAF5475577.1 hypothetical protein F2P56_007371 [Juglans regia]
MVKSPDRKKILFRKGAWSPEEDQKLKTYIERYGIWNWSRMPKPAGLARSGKSCRLRWVNYLRPDIKRGNFSEEDEETILKWHEVLGNRWSVIAAKLPGRTDNEIKNYWHTHLKKRLKNNSLSTTVPQTVVDVNKNNSSGIQDLLLCDAPKVSNLDGTRDIIPMSPQLSTDHDLSSSSTDPAVEIDRKQPIEENFGSSKTSEELQTSWEQTLSVQEQDIFMPETDPGFVCPTTAVWLQDPIYHPYSSYNEFWVDL